MGSLIAQNCTFELYGQLQKKAMDSTRLGIPVLIGADVIHGLKILYPIPLAQACSWNPALIQQVSSLTAAAARKNGIAWFFSPMVDVAYDPRWGRVAEGYGEDPYVNTRFGVAAIKGYQGNDLGDGVHVAACLKHYVGYSRSEGGRDYSYTDFSRQALWETYLVPFEAGIKAGAATVMSSFNDINGTPATANHYTLTEILKQRWGHKGFVVSDWLGVGQLVNQGVAKDKKEAGKLALMAGVDMDMLDNIFRTHMPALLKEKKVTQSRLDDAVKRVLTLKFKLGLFDKPYPETGPINDQEIEKLATQIASESMVLLKNINLLPLAASAKTIAVIGPIAKDKENVVGSWISQANLNNTKSFFEGLKEEFGNTVSFNYQKGCDFDGTDESGFEAALEAANSADIVLVCLGEKRRWSGENASRSTLNLPDIQERLVTQVKKSEKPMVLILSSGRPVALNNLEPLADAILQAWQPGTHGASALAGILSGRINPSGKLAITFPLTTGQIPNHYNQRQSARPKSGKYQDISSEPLYPFGYGLSYTKYQYSNLTLSKTTIDKNKGLKASVTVKNIGGKDGAETVLWFITDVAATISRPVKELKYFEKKWIKAGDSVIFSFEIDPERDLSYPNAEGNRILEAGDFYLMAQNEKKKFKLK